MRQAADTYLRTKVLTATAEQLQLMLFDGAIRFCEQARPALEHKKFDQSHLVLTRALKIVNQLRCALNHDVAPELCAKLAGIYTYAYRRIVEANTKHSVAALDEAIRLLKYQRETWVLLLDKLSRQKAGLAVRSIDFPAPDPGMEATISMQG